MANHKLYDRTCRSAKPGMHGDGGGLFLKVSGKTARSWLFIYRVGSKRTELGLGGYPAVNLARARQLASELRSARAEGIDPREARGARRQRSVKFGEVAEVMLEALSPGWSNATHCHQWRKSLTVDAAMLRDMPIGSITTDHILQALQPHWLSRPESARRLRLRLEKLLDFAKARGLRDGENPARWRGHLANLLPKQSKIRQHFAAMPYSDLPQFLTEVRGKSGYGALALQLLVLTATRTAEVVGARWDEFDLEARLWSIPAARMKSRREHRVPLSGAALVVLRQLWEVRRGPYVFPSHDASRHAAETLMAHVVQRSGRRETVHGFRASFRTWASEQTAIPREVIEMALSHVVGSAVERAYARSDLFERRAQLMEMWAGYCTSKPAAKVIALQR